MTGWHARRTALLNQLQADRHLTEEWRPSFEAVPRHLFIPDQVWRVVGSRCVPVDKGSDPDTWGDLVYSDEPVVTQFSDGANGGTDATSSSSMPSMVAKMLRQLGVGRGGKVLEVGTGTGWNAALLSCRLGARNVTTVEVDQKLAESARRALQQAGQLPEVIWGDGGQGWARSGPYDGVLLTCSVRSVPYRLLEQCRIGAAIVAPMSNPFWCGALARLTVRKGGTASGPFTDSADFMLMRSQRISSAGVAVGGQGRTSPTDLRTARIARLGFAIFAHARLPELRMYGRREEGRYRVWLQDGSGSGAVADGTGAVTEYGPRALWEETEELWEEYRGHGSPAASEFGLTVRRDDQSVWLREPDNVVRPAKRESPTVR